MRYISTRGGEAPALGFEDVLLTGLATDGGLYVPESLPHFSLEEIRSWRGLPYAELAYKVMYPFVEDAIPADDFRKMLDETYSVFSHQAVAPLVQLDTNEWVMELFRGPTLASRTLPAAAGPLAGLRSGEAQPARCDHGGGHLR